MVRPSAPARPHKVRGFWFLVRRVPGEYTLWDARKLVRISTRIRIVDDPRGVRAGKVVAKLDAELLRYWQDKRRGRDRDVELTHQQACNRARALGLDYVPAAEAAPFLPVEELLRRFDTLIWRGSSDGAEEVSAVLGGAEEPRLMLDDLLDEYEEVMRATLAMKSKSQRKKWRGGKEMALKVLLDAVGNRAVTSLTRADALKLRSHWQDRVVAGEVEIATANRCIGHVSGMYRAISEAKQLNLPAIFSKVRISGGRDRQRLAYAPDFVQRRILAQGMFEDLNPEARRVIYLLVETGLRLSEAVNLTASFICLDGPVPHVRILPEGRALKTSDSEREIPLVGVALQAMRAQRHGFPRYRDKADTLSALVNKVLDGHGLRPEPGQSLYSLRHTFEDRLTAVNAPDKVIACLMGRKWSRPRYGVGPSLELKRDWLVKIVFEAPAEV